MSFWDFFFNRKKRVLGAIFLSIVSLVILLSPILYTPVFNIWEGVFIYLFIPFINWFYWSKEKEHYNDLKRNGYL